MTITSNTPALSFAAAVWTFGDYPNVTWEKAIKRLEMKIRLIARCGEISPTSLWILGRKTFGKHYKLL